MNNDLKQVDDVLYSFGVKTKWFGIKYKSMGRVMKKLSKKWKSFDQDTKDKVSHAILGQID